jgi:hypothetical protein
MTATPKLPITVIVPTKNEEKNIRACLESVPWADQVFVVDSRSRDRTAEIARELGVEVVDFDYDGGWPKKKNWAIRTLPIRTPWFLILDADERVDAELAAELAGAVKREDVDGFYVRWRFMFLGRWMRHSWSHGWMLRLVRTGRGEYEDLGMRSEGGWDNEVHENIVVTGKTARLQSWLTHDSNESLSYWIRKQNEFSDWNAVRRLRQLRGGNAAAGRPVVRRPAAPAQVPEGRVPAPAVQAGGDVPLPLRREAGVPRRPRGLVLLRAAGGARVEHQRQDLRVAWQKIRLEMPYEFNVVPVEPAAFIVGMSRSGTSWLMQALNYCTDAAVFGETGYWGKNFHTTADGTYGPEEIDAILRRLPGNKGHSLEPRSTENVDRVIGGYALRKLLEPLRFDLVNSGARLGPSELFNLMCGVVASYSGKTVAVEKTPHHINWTERISSAYPGAKLIVTSRDPYGFMRSYKHQGDRMPEPVRRNFRSLYHPIGCALAYRGYARRVEQLRSVGGDRVLCISLEQIEADAAAVLVTVASFLGVGLRLDALPSKFNTSFPEGSRQQLEAADLFWINVIAGRHARQLGYQTDSSATIRDGLPSLVGLPAWGWRAFRHLRAKRYANVWAYLRRWVG